VRIGNVELHALSDGVFRLDGGAMFGTVPKVLWERRAPADERNRITLGLRPLCVRTAHEAVVIDSGVGPKMSDRDIDLYAIDRRPSLDVSLASVGLSASDITSVIATHLHWDHAGGFTVREGADIVPAFPRARYIIRKGEWDDATHPHARNRASYLADNFVPLERAGVVEFVDADVEVRPGIHLRRTGGHTAHHQIVTIDTGERTVVFAGDLWPTTAHIDDAWIMGYDLYPMETLAFKTAFVREAIEREYVIFFEHDPAIRAGVIRTDGRRKWVEPLEAA